MNEELYQAVKNERNVNSARKFLEDIPEFAVTERQAILIGKIKNQLADLEREFYRVLNMGDLTHLVEGSIEARITSKSR